MTDRILIKSFRTRNELVLKLGNTEINNEIFLIIRLPHLASADLLEPHSGDNVANVTVFIQFIQIIGYFDELMVCVLFLW